MFIKTILNKRFKTICSAKIPKCVILFLFNLTQKGPLWTLDKHAFAYYQVSHFSSPAVNPINNIHSLAVPCLVVFPLCSALGFVNLGKMQKWVEIRARLCSKPWLLLPFTSPQAPQPSKELLNLSLISSVSSKVQKQLLHLSKRRVRKLRALIQIQQIQVWGAIWLWTIVSRRDEWKGMVDGFPWVGGNVWRLFLLSVLIVRGLKQIPKNWTRSRTHQRTSHQAEFLQSMLETMSFLQTQRISVQVEAVFNPAYWCKSMIPKMDRGEEINTWENHGLLRLLWPLKLLRKSLPPSSLS